MKKIGSSLVIVISLLVAITGIQNHDAAFVRKVIPNEHVFIKEIDPALAQSYADEHGYILLDCIDQIGWCQFRGTLSLYFNALGDSIEEDDEIGIFPPIEGERVLGINMLSETVFNDPEYINQWNIHMGGYLPLLEDGLMCSSNVSVVVIDTGYAFHADLANISECSGVSGLPCEDGNGHGTHVLGVGAMVPNNILGGVGVGSLCNFKSIKALGDRGNGSFFSIAQAITQAVDEFKADVINLSLGADIPTPKVLAAALDYAEVNGRGGKGAVVVGAAGNAARDRCGTPANYPSVLCVGAVDAQGKMPTFSNRGEFLDVVAPGVDILSTVTNNSWKSWSGTSMASPHVAMGIGLFLSHYPNAQEMTAAQIRDRVRETAIPLDACPACGKGLFTAHSMLSTPAPTPECRELKIVDFPGDRASSWDAWNLVATNNQLMGRVIMSYDGSNLIVSVDNQALCNAWEIVFSSEGYTVQRAGGLDGS